MLKTIFEMAGYKVHTAINGYQAFEILCQMNDGFFDLVVLDLNMPISDGYDTCRNIIR